MKTELEYLRYILTPYGLKPQPKKVEAIQRILPPKNKRQLRCFLGMINYYRNMWLEVQEARIGPAHEVDVR